MRISTKLLLNSSALFLLLYFVSVHLRSFPIYGLTESGDYYAFWLAAISFKEQINPYKIISIQSHFANQGISIARSEQVWALPHVFSYLWLFSFLDFKDFIKVTTYVQCTMYIACILILVKKYFPKEVFTKNYSGEIYFYSSLAIITLLNITYYYSLMLGPIIGLSLLGLSIYVSQTEDTGKTNFWGGLGLSIAVIKPHLFLFVTVFFLIKNYIHKNWNAFGGFLTGLLIFALPVILYHPQIISYYLDLWLNGPEGNTRAVYYFTPCIADWLKFLDLGISNITIFFSLSLLAVYSLMLIFIVKSFITKNELLSSLILSIVLAPYCWVYDFIILTPVFVYLLGSALTMNKKILYKVLLAVVLINLTITITYYQQRPMVIYPLLTAVLFYWLESYLSKSKC